MLRSHLPNMTEELAQKSYSLLVDPTRGFARHAEIDMAGVREVLALRTRYGVPHKVLDDPGKYYDPAYYEAATR